MIKILVFLLEKVITFLRGMRGRLIISGALCCAVLREVFSDHLKNIPNNKQKYS